MQLRRKEARARALALPESIFLVRGREGHIFEEMDDAFELVDPQDAQDFLKLFPAEVRRKGEALFRSGRVLELNAETPGTDYAAAVQDGEDHAVSLRYEDDQGWGGNCSCLKPSICEHLYAAMSALLAEYRTAAVRGLSSSMRSAVARLAESRWKQKVAGNRETNELAERVQAAKGQKLSSPELSFLRKVHTVYTRCCQSRRITYWDFQEMGLPLQDYSWAELKIWPAFPKDEYEFWLYVAHALQEKGSRIPDFMALITDFSIIQERLERWKRTLEVEEWKRKLRGLGEEPNSQAPDSFEIDLRLALKEDEARLEWRQPDKAGFEPLKQSQFRQLMESEEEGCLHLTPEAELIWQVFRYGFEYEPRPKLAYDLLGEPGVLNRLLRMRTVESRIVNAAGEPLTRQLQPLRWEVTPAMDAQDDYRLRLVQADGSPAPRFLAVLSGRPTLYLTAQGLFTGPEAAPDVLEPDQENRIPAAAIENAEGVAFLESLGVQLPPSLGQRVRTISYQVAITCELRHSFPAGNEEECVIQVIAEAPDGHQTSYTGSSWKETHRRESRRKPGDPGEIVRYDSAALRQVPKLLAPLNMKSAVYTDGLRLRVTRRFPETFTGWLKSLPPSILVQLKGELASLASAEVAGRVKLDVTEVEIDWFDLRVGLDVADTTLTPSEIKLLLNAKGGYVRLKGKGWRRLQFDLSEEEDERLSRLGLSPRELSAEPQRLHALQLADDAAKKFLPEPQVVQIQRRAGEIKARVAPAVPAAVIGDLRPYQLEGFHFLAYLSTNRFGGILADDMGLGKTLQALAWLVWLREQKVAGERDPGARSDSDPRKPAEEKSPVNTTALVVCPKSVMDNWHAEAARFVPGLRVKVWSAGDLRDFGRQLSTADVHVLNYSQLRLLGEALGSLRWLAAILDEGQYIKNPNSQTAQIARSLRAEHRLILSGTPIENRLMDLWSLMAFAMPGILSSRAQFGRLYDAKGDPFARRRLAARVRPFVLRRTKGQVAKDLPERIEEDLFCEIEGEQETLYRAELKRAQQLLLGIRTQKELAQQQFHFLTSLLRLRQVCCHPRLMKPDSTASSAKTEALLEQIGPLMEEGQKVLVFSQFVEMLDILQPLLVEQGWPVFYLAGQTENRGELVRQFQSAEGPAVFLISLKAGGFGLNLTAASYVILFDPWWNPAVENQAIDRTHRIGQTNNVIAYRLLIKNSIEEKIRELQKHKKALADDVLGEEKFAQSLTLEDLRFLFAD